MNSCFYECQITHRRSAPRVHQFGYHIFLFAMDLDELGALHRKISVFSVNRPNLYSFRDGDYLPTQERLHGGTDHALTSPVPPQDASERVSSCEPRTRLAPAVTLRQRVVAYAATRGVDLSEGKVILVTLPRVFGTLFNPVSFYFCYDRDGEPIAALAEVTNTFREMKPFFLGPSTKMREPVKNRTGEMVGLSSTARSKSTFRLRVPKNFYVSPFSDIDVEFDFRLRAPGEILAVQIDDYAGGKRTFQSTLTGRRKELSSARLVWYTVKYPLITLRIVALIHWHALLLWAKKIPWFTKSARGAEQRDLYRAHLSLTRPPHPAAALNTVTPSTSLEPLSAQNTV